VARSFATLHTHYVSDVTLLAAGGQKPVIPEQRNTLLTIFITQDDETRVGFIEKGFFAPGGDASVWLYGWNTTAALSQGFAAENPDVDFFTAGGKPILLIQLAEDFIAPPEDAGRLLAEQLGDQVTYVEIARTGHALLPERPDTVAARIIAYFASSQSRGY
jgi:pimeloyl-ACP methyl ester carboxylesterase